MMICTSWWHTSARCYTLLAVDRFDSGAPTSAHIGTSQWFPSLVAWTHLWSLLAHVHLFRGVRLHVISNPILHLMCLKLATCVVYYGLFDLSCRTKLCPFWKFILEGLFKNCTTWSFSLHTFSMFPIGTCMTPNLQKCKLKKTQGQSIQFQRWWHPQTHHPQSTHIFGIAVAHAWVYNLMCIPLLTILHSKRELQTLLDMCWMV